MLTADSVYTIAKVLSKEELTELYARIGKYLNKDYLPKRSNKEINRITVAEIGEMLWKRYSM
ncbi:hypothetical protein [Psychroflexus sp. MES1-P1E]|uniref:hypothetical protein n=1 Tax=Psychroflexus sp. MES1-P1E TaxID=2058320 RepID=UPI000C7C1DD9|nr:hypothetical protein [Psychroflexus sp. MES1-P1E]PKG42575.1 hypothetical protein CXF67_09555 [Psychroflexus sp. MES1-P1E]